ncbi:MAG: drug/metabolite transporter (DMT)-like permease [Bacteroidia bacterium]|jgi:drug/metabolite transporter (DMT)-like permease
MKNNLRVHLSLLTVAIIYGANYTIAKGVMPQYLGASGFVFIRIFVAAILFNLVYLFRRKEEVKNKKHFVQFVIAATFGVAGNMLLFFNGLAHTTEINASVLMLNAPVFVLIFSVFVLKDKVRPWQAVGMLLAAAGALFLIGGTKLEFTTESASGDIMVLLNATSFAFYLVYVKRLLSQYSALFVIKNLFIVGTIMALPFAWNDLQTASYAEFPIQIWYSIAFVAIMTTFVAYLLNAWSVQKASPNLVASYIYLQPVIATFIAINAGNQSLSWEKVIFALVIFTGVYLVNSNRYKA